MFLTIVGPVGHREEMAVDCPVRLGEVFRAERVFINGVEREDWQDYVPRRGDRVEVWQEAGFVALPGLVIGGISISSAVVTAVANAVLSIVLSLALSGITRALTPKPKKPRSGGKEEAFGIAGFSNTVGPGTRKFVPYGINQIHGHVIGSGASLSADGRQMMGRILYFMGDTGGDGIDGIQDVQIDGTDIFQFPEIWGDGIGTPTNHMAIRLGYDIQDVIPEFENVDNLFSDGRALPFDTETSTGTPIIYTTQSAGINRATLFLFFPGGLYRVNSQGRHRQSGVKLRIEYKKNVDSSWTLLAEPEYPEMIEGGTFKTYAIDFPSASQWDIRLTKIQILSFAEGGTFIHDTILYNVQETVFTTNTYPGSALLGLTNLPANKIRSFQAMECSAVVRGKRVKIPDGLGNTTLAYTRQRCWIVRDMMTQPIVGMGSEIAETEINDEQWLESQVYYDEQVLGHDGLEVRDLCDVVVNDADWDWEWVKKVAGEARGRIIPSGDQWNYVIDKPGPANLLYAEGSNIIEGSIGLEISHPDRPFNQISAKFRDADKEYDRNYANPITDPDIGADPIVQEVVQYDTITRESEVQRENMIIFKRAFLERRRWTYQSPMGAIVSEPMDLDYLAERNIGNEGSYSGILGPGSTAVVVVLPEPVEIEPGPSYALIVGHTGDNTTEYRQVANAPGVTTLISVGVTPFIQAPAEGDRFSLGKETIDHIITRAQELEIDSEGRVRQLRTEYIPDVYTQDPLPSKTQRRFFNLKDDRPPLPLRYATVVEQVTINRDGSTRSVLLFIVTPGLAQHAGVAQGGLTDRIILANSEPAISEYFVNAKVTVNGEQRTINFYDGFTRSAFILAPAFTTPPQAGDSYTMLWERFAEFGGFNIEHSEDGVNFFKLAVVLDTHYETDSMGVGPGLIYFRLTPFSNTRVENGVARHIIAVNIQGDLSAPAAPLSVAITSYLLTVRVLVVMQRPMAEDFNGVEIELWRNALDTGLLLETTRFGAPADSAASGTMQIEASFNLGARTPPEPYGAVIWARASSVDFSQNKSAPTDAPAGTTLTPDPRVTGATLGPPAVPTGLTLATGVQIDPADGVSKVFLDISWNANIEADISRYEIHYRRQDGPTGVTARVVSHPQISIREIGLVGNVVYEVRIQAIDTTNTVSGFTPYLAILSARDNVPPGPPTIFSITGGFKLVSIFFTPPHDPDFECVQVYLSTVNDLATAVPWGESAARSIQFVATFLANNTVYYFWLRSRDKSGNVGAFHTTQFNGTAAVTLKIDGNDVVTTSALITNFAQIQTAIITDAHISDLSVNKLTVGDLAVVMRVGVAGQIYIDGVSRIIAVYDDNTVPRVQLGKLGPAATDYGLQVFGSDGTLWHSFTSGVQTAGISAHAVTDFIELRDDSLQFLNTILEETVGSLGFTTSGNPVTVFARVKIQKNPSNLLAGSPFFARLYRDGILIDEMSETTSNGKHFVLYDIDAPGAGFHTYALKIAHGGGTGLSCDATAVVMSLLEQKR